MSAQKFVGIFSFCIMMDACTKLLEGEGCKSDKKRGKNRKERKLFFLKISKDPHFQKEGCDGCDKKADKQKTKRRKEKKDGPVM